MPPKPKFVPVAERAPLAEILKRARTEAGLSQAALAEKLGYKNNSSLSRVETTEYAIEFHEAERWLEACGKRLSWTVETSDAQKRTVEVTPALAALLVQARKLDERELERLEMIAAYLPHLDTQERRRLNGDLEGWAEHHTAVRDALIFGDDDHEATASSPKQERG